MVGLLVWKKSERLQKRDINCGFGRRINYAAQVCQLAVLQMRRPRRL